MERSLSSKRNLNSNRTKVKTLFQPILPLDSSENRKKPVERLCRNNLKSEQSPGLKNKTKKIET